MSGELSIAAVWSRVHDAPVGRTPIVDSIRRGMRSFGTLDEHVLSTVLESRRPGPVLRAGAWVAGAMLRGRPLSLQATLFADGARNRALADTIRRADPDVVYLDGVRTYPVLEALIERGGVRRIVTDFDDLMSRRMAEFRSSGVVPLGYVGKSLPGWARGLANQQAFGRAVLDYERGMLQGVERRMTAAGDAAVLLSTADAAMLRDLVAPELRERVHVIPPCFDVVRPVPDGPQPVRFVFIGSDRQSQNRLTIEYLVSVWAECRPAAPLVIGGPMVRQWPETPNVTFTGWLERTSDLYTPGSVMLTPSFIRGGIKTKVLDAFAHGCAAIGNEATFEGLPQLDAYPFRFDDAGLRAFLADLPRQAGPLHEAARMGQKVLREHFSREGFVRAWEGVLSGRTERAGSAVA
jgi:hypothetical protein